ncbi:hypothetical protein ADL21_00835 [Streptomyces albus subsp. albus]|nr:hypothetical protein ADL21_00835 [Streptomyces albus subsp. albus]
MTTPATSHTAAPAPADAPGQPAAHGPLPSVLRGGLTRGLLETRAYLRNRTALVFSLLMPLVLMVAFATVFSGTVPGTDVPMNQVTIAGMIGSVIMSASFGTIGFTVALEREDGTLKRLATTPLAPVSYLIAKWLFVVLVTLFQVAVMLAVGVLLFHFRMPATPGRWAAFAWVLALGILASSVLGFAVGFLVPNSQSAPAVINFPFIVLQFVSGVFYVFTGLPKALQYVGALFPLKWLAQGIRYAFLPDRMRVAEPAGTWELGRIALVLTAWLVAGLLLALFSFRRKSFD